MLESQVVFAPPVKPIKIGETWHPLRLAAMLV
jgi:hypothetical protein